MPGNWVTLMGRISINSGINVAIEQEQPLYIQQEALEKEISLIDARQRYCRLSFHHEYADLVARKRALESDKRPERIDAGLTETFAADTDRFAAANYDLEPWFRSNDQQKLNCYFIHAYGRTHRRDFCLLRSALSARKNQSPN